MAAKSDAKPDSRDNFQVITDELIRYGGRQKTTATSRYICCPLPDHGGENTPSCGVFMQIDAGIPLGFYHCFGCGGKGPWNQLAEIAGFEKIQEWKKSGDVQENIVNKAVEADLLGESGETFAHVKEVMGCNEARRWPISLAWRGFSGQLIHDVGGHIVEDRRKDSVGVLFPVKVNGKVRGGIKAVFEREGKELGYVNMPGTWTAKYGLFPYVYSKKIIKSGVRFVILVEGPRDALRLVALGMPALAILGATSMSAIKAMIVSSLDITHVYVMSDNDKGGDQMWKTTKKALKAQGGVKVQRMKLPRRKDAEGNLIKLDPGNAPKKILKRVISYLEETHPPFQAQRNQL